MTIKVICATVFLVAAIGSKCDGGSGGSSSSRLTRVGSIKLEGPTRITNGESANYTLTVTRPETDKKEQGDVPISGSNKVLANVSVQFEKGEATDIRTFPLRCTPAGREGKLAGPLGNSGHGSRICDVKGIAPATFVVCNDDPVDVSATFPNSVSNSISIVCKPSEGPTEGTKPPDPPSFPSPNPPKPQLP